MQDEALDGAHVIRPVAHIKTPYPVKFGVPRQPGLVDALEGVVYFEPEFRDADAVRGTARPRYEAGTGSLSSTRKAEQSRSRTA